MTVTGKYNIRYKEFVENQLEEHLGPPELSADYKNNFVGFYLDNKREMQNYLRSFIFSKVKELKESVDTDASLQDELDYYYDLFEVLLKTRGFM